MSRLIVVVPCYNEARRLDCRAVEEYGRRHDAAELLFVNDGSRDATLDVLAQVQKTNPRRFSCLHLAQNGGKAEAVRQGLLAAIARGAEYVGYWDADLATPLADIEPFRRILATRPSIDLVVGMRMRLLGHRIERKPLRHLLGRVFATTAAAALGVGIYDTQCGAKLLRVTPELWQAISRPFLTRWIFDVELMARLQLARRASKRPPLDEAIYEFALDSWRDVAGSSVRSADFVKAIGEMSRIYWNYLRPGARLPADMLAATLPQVPTILPSSDQKAA